MKKWMKPYLPLIKKASKQVRLWISELRPIPTALAVFGILVLLVFFVERPRLKQFETETYVVPQFEAEAATLVEVFSPTGEFRYEKGDARFPEELLKGIHDLKIEQKVSNNPGKHALYGVDAVHATHVVIKDEKDKVLVDFYLGLENDFGRQYLKKPVSSEVYEVTPSLKSLLPLPDLGRYW